MHQMVREHLLWICLAEYIAIGLYLRGSTPKNRCDNKPHEIFIVPLHPSLDKPF